MCSQIVRRQILISSVDSILTESSIEMNYIIFFYISKDARDRLMESGHRRPETCANCANKLPMRSRSQKGEERN